MLYSFSYLYKLTIVSNKSLPKKKKRIRKKRNRKHPHRVLLNA